MEQIAGITVERKEKDINPTVSGIPPRGYVTLEQFAEDTKAIINDYCDLTLIKKR
jgi:hypothetical protein